MRAVARLLGLQKKGNKMQILMNRTSLLLALISILACTAAANRANSADGASSSISIAFIDVNVISMNREEILKHQTVLTQHGLIVAMGPAVSISVPSGTLRIAGAQRYLLPGLIDMHVHFRRVPNKTDVSYAQFPDYRERNDDMGLLLVANGITSVRQMHGHPIGDELVAKSRRNWLGPTIYSSGPINDGDPPVHPYSRIVTTAADAAQVVAEDKAKGYVAVKVYDHLTLPVYEALVAAAAADKIDVVGHVPDAVGLARVIAAHQATIEHTDSFVYTLQPGDGPYAAPAPDSKWSDLIERADLSKLTVLADQMRRDGIWTCPTVVVIQIESRDYERLPETKYMPSAFRAALHDYYSPQSVEKDRAFAVAVVRRLHERGAGLLLGTDAYLVVPGFSAIQELENFAEAGLTPYEALQTGTINAARALHEESAIGTIDVGKQADLLLLEGNPLMDLANMKKVAGVTLRGRWLPQSELQSRLAAVAKSVATP
jgi:imidazolonepropionase-like amidohydrolase